MCQFRRRFHEGFAGMVPGPLLYEELEAGRTEEKRFLFSQTRSLPCLSKPLRLGEARLPT